MQAAGRQCSFYPRDLGAAASGTGVLGPTPAGAGDQETPASRSYVKPASQNHTPWRARLLPFHFHELLSAYLIRFDVVRELIRRYFSDDIPHCGHYEPRANHASSFQKYSFGNDLFLFVLKW